MTEQAKSGHLGQFLGDLSAIRKKRNVSLEALRDATKVYPNIIAQFEEDGLVNHSLFNALYVRAFVRSYSETLEINADNVLKAYDQALEGKYDRSLAVAYLDLPAEEVEAIQANIAAQMASPPETTMEDSKEETSRTKPERTATAKSSAKPGAGSAAKSAGTRQSGRRNRDKAATSRSEAKRKANKERELQEAASSGAAITFIPKSSDEQTTPVGAMIAGVQASLASLFEKGKQSPIFQWGLLVGGLGLGLFVILQLLSFQSGPGEEEPASLEMNALQESTRAASLPDSIAAMPTEVIEVTRPEVPVVLGDSIPVYIVAATGKLDPFRVRLDRDLRRPYWLEQGDTMLFHFKEQTVIEDNLSAMKILIEGYTYPIYETDSLATVIIDRDSVQAFLATR